MEYFFDRKNDRSLTGSIKWDRWAPGIPKINAYPMSYADMDLRTSPEIQEALASASKHGFDIVYKPHRHTVFPSISEDFAHACVLCTSPSKTFNLAGLKHANIIIPNKSLRDAYERHFDGGVLPYRIFCPLRRDIVAYRSSVPWMESMLEYIHGNDQMFGAFMASELPGIVKYPLEGTFLAWTDCRSLGLSQDALESFILNEAQLALNEGYIFGHSGSGFERWNLAMPRPALEENLHRFASAVKRLVNRPGCRKHGLPPAARRGRLFLSYQGIRAGLGQTPNPFIEYLRY